MMVNESLVTCVCNRGVTEEHPYITRIIGTRKDIQTLQEALIEENILDGNDETSLDILLSIFLQVTIEEQRYFLPENIIVCNNLISIRGAEFYSNTICDLKTLIISIDN